RDDGREEQIVAAAGASDTGIPRRSIPRPDVQKIQVGIVRERVPNRTSSAVLPPFSLPRGRCLLEYRRFERLRRISRNGIEAPSEVAAVGVVCGKVTAHSELGTAVADDDLAFDDPR